MTFDIPVATLCLPSVNVLQTLDISNLNLMLTDCSDSNLELEVAVTLVFLWSEDLGPPVRPVLGSLLVLLLNIPVQQTGLTENGDH